MNAFPKQTRSSELLTTRYTTFHTVALCFNSLVYENTERGAQLAVGYDRLPVAFIFYWLH